MATAAGMVRRPCGTSPAVADGLLHPVLLGDVRENQNDANDPPCLAADGCGAIGDLVPLPVACQQYRMVGQTDHFAAFHDQLDRIVHGLAAVGVDDPEYFRKRASSHRTATTRSGVRR